MKTGKNKKTGISLIVLVITIIVMIILATAVVLTLSNSGIISKANDVVTATDLANMQDLASMLWADKYLELRLEDGVVDANDLVALRGAVESGLKKADKNYSAKYNIEVTESGVTVTIKSEEELGFPIEWNTLDVMENTSFVFDEMPFVKVSEFTPTAAELAGTEISVTMGEERVSLECEEVQDMSGFAIAVYDGMPFFSVTTAGENAELGITFPEPGFYVPNFGLEGMDADFVISKAKDTLAPYVVTTVTESTTNKITVEVDAKDNGINASGIKEYRYYIKESDASKYELKSTSNTTTYTYTGLNENKNYNIMVEVEDNVGNIGNGKTTKGSWITATVDTVPIPKGFVASPYGADEANGLPAENTKAGGLVIYELKAGETAIPSTETRHQSQTTRNQYVWVPVEDFNDFIRQNFGKSYTISNTIGTDYWEIILNVATNTPNIQSSIEQYKYMTSETLQEIQNMYESIKEYKGFYIARYEAGYDGGENYTRTEENCKDADGNIVSEAKVYSMMNKKPYNYIPWTQNDKMNEDTNGAVEAARNMYPESNANYGVVSTLTYGVQWDRTLTWWKETSAKNGTGDVTITTDTNLNDSTKYGNYYNNEIPENTFNEGAKCSKDNGDSYGDITAGKTASEYWLLTTGATEEARVNNIYDMAGNLWEWTMGGYSSDFRVLRGGGFGSDYGDYYPVSNRYFDYQSNVNFYRGFRPSLYIKK